VQVRSKFLRITGRRRTTFRGLGLPFQDRNSRPLALGVLTLLLHFLGTKVYSFVFPRYNKLNGSPACTEEGPPEGEGSSCRGPSHCGNTDSPPCTQIHETEKSINDQIQNIPNLRLKTVWQQPFNISLEQFQGSIYQFKNHIPPTAIRQK
jgi:hypothetical protein